MRQYLLLERWLWDLPKFAIDNGSSTKTFFILNFIFSLIGTKTIIHPRHNHVKVSVSSKHRKCKWNMEYSMIISAHGLIIGLQCNWYYITLVRWIHLPISSTSKSSLRLYLAKSFLRTLICDKQYWTAMSLYSGNYRYLMLSLIISRWYIS